MDNNHPPPSNEVASLKQQVEDRIQILEATLRLESQRRLHMAADSVNERIDSFFRFMIFLLTIAILAMGIIFSNYLN